MKLADNKATLSFSNGSPSVDLPVYQGSVGPEVVDIRKLYAQVGTATFYHANYVLAWWAASMYKDVTGGANIFYRWRSGLAGEMALRTRSADA